MRSNIKDLKWPKFIGRMPWYISLVSLILATVIFCVPDWSAIGFNEYRILVVILIIVVPFIIFRIIPWIIRVSMITIQRVTSYPKLEDRYSKMEYEFNELKNNLVEVILNKFPSELEIEEVSYDRGSLYLIIKKKEETGVEIGDIIEVIHKRDLMLMGRFEISEIRSQVYYAKDDGHVDNLWLTVVKQQGATRLTPNMSAFHIPKGGNNA